MPAQGQGEQQKSSHNYQSTFSNCELFEVDINIIHSIDPHQARNVAGAPDPMSMGQQESLSAKLKGFAADIPSPKNSRNKPVVKEQKEEVDLSFNDVTTVAEPNNALTTISLRRLEALASLPVIIPDTDINDEDNKFTRGFTSAAIGGSIQSLIVR